MAKKNVMIISYDLISGGSELNAYKITKYIPNNYFWVSLGKVRKTSLFDNKNIKKFFFLNHSFFKFFQSLIILKNIIKKNKVSTIYSLGLYPNLLSCIVSLLTNVKVIITRRNEISNKNKIIYLFHHLVIIYLSDLIETNSKFIYEKSKKNFFLKKKIIYNKNLIEPHIYAGTRAKLLKRKKNTKIIGYSGNLRPVKDPELLKNTLNLILKNKNNLIVIVGRDYKNYFKDLKKKYKKRIFWLKFLPRNKMKKFYNSIDLLLLTSKSEGSPNVVAESFSNGVPVVTVPLNGIKGLIIDSYNGKISKNRNLSEIYNSFLYVNKNLIKLSRNSKKFFNSNFHFRNTLLKISKYL